MTEIEEMAALADELDTYDKRYSGDWSNALPSMSWAKLGLIVKALRSASRTGPGFVENLTCHCHDEVSRKYCLDKDRCTPMAEAQAALPATVGESVTAEELTDFIRSIQHFVDPLQAKKFLSTFTITRKSENEGRS